MERYYNNQCKEKKNESLQDKKVNKKRKEVLLYGKRYDESS